MGFDKDDERQIVDVEKPTTKVNFSLVIGILVFFVIGGICVWWFWVHPPS